MKYVHWRESPLTFLYSISWQILFLLSSAQLYLKLLETKGYIDANSQEYHDLNSQLKSLTLNIL